MWQQHELLTYSPGGVTGVAVDTIHSSDVHRFFINWHIQEKYV